MHYELLFLKSLALTITIETAILIVVTKVLLKQEIKTKYLILTGVVATMATLPYFWFIYPLFIKSKVFYYLASETSAVMIETFIIYAITRINILKSALLSFACNGTSYIIGLIII